MKNPKNILAYAAIVACAVSPCLAFAEKSVPADAAVAAAAKKTSTPAGWTDDFENAKKLAAETNRDLFVLFTGSDWCSWCIRLEKEVISQNGFTEKLSEKFVPVFIDIPGDKALLSALAAEQNQKIVERYRVEGFPTVLLMDAEGFTFAQTGYQAGGPEAYLKSLSTLANEGKNSAEYKTTKAIATLPKDAPDRIARLDDLLSALPTETQNHYFEYVEEILAADPDGALGYRAKYPYFAVAGPIVSEFRELITSIILKTEEDLKARGLGRTEENVKACATARIAERKADFDAVRAKATAAQPLFPKGTLGARTLEEILLSIDFYEKYFLTPTEKTDAQ